MLTSRQIALSAVVSMLTAGTLVFFLRQDNPWPKIYRGFSGSIVELYTVSSGGISRGTGFILNAGQKAVIATSGHVVSGSLGIRVKFWDEVETEGYILDVSDAQDLALLRVEDVNLQRYGGLGWTHSRSLEIGEQVMTIGHPVGSTHHLSVGFYTGHFTQENGRTLLRLAMSVDPGNSGGPVFDRHGRVVGVISEKVGSSSNIAFATPIEKVESMASWSADRRPNPRSLAQDAPTPSSPDQLWRLR